MTSTNWAGNLNYAAASFHRPQSVDELSEVVAAAPLARALGSRHSFNHIADTTGAHISLERMPAELTIDQAARTVTVNAGARYGEFAERLDAAGFAVHNLASLPHISVAGAIATGTHGSGDSNPSLAAAVAGVEMVKADGTLVVMRRGEPDFDGVVVALGMLGILTRISLDIVPAFKVRQDVYENLAWSSLADNFDAITSSAYSVSLFTHWGDEGITQAWRKSRVDAAADLDDRFFGATRAKREMHPLPDVSAENTTQQLGVAGPWWDRLPHFRLGFTPSNGEELQSEYLMPRRHALAAVEAIRGIAARLRPHLFVSELRTMAADDLWLSPALHEDCAGIHFTWRQHIPEVSALLPLVDAALAPFDARPHWGKVFETDRDRLAELYPKLPVFRDLAARMDPDAVFRNDFVDRWIGR
ncbi:MAG: FAD-binding protein [Microbacteriaceae bacterium]|jgi:xylitol oxidase|nr:FAD-binding protein [Microbacteriaceae bacterium]HEV7956201.1 FAD-binding protein [Marisediminicola sp.]